MTCTNRVSRARLVSVIIAIVLVAATATSARQQAPADPAAISRLDAQLTAARGLLKERRWDEAQTEFESALATAVQIGSLDLEGRALLGLTQVAYNKATYPRAREVGLRALAVAERVGNAAGIGEANMLLAYTAGYMGNPSEVRPRLERAVTAYEAAGDGRGLAMVTIGLAKTVPADAPDLFTMIELAIERARASGDLALQGEAAHLYGDQLFARGDYGPALEQLEGAAAFYTAANNPEQVGMVYNSVGRVYRAHGQLHVALDYQLKALDLHERGRHAFARMQSLNAVAAVYGMLGENDKARSYTQRAVKEAEEFGSPRVQDFLRANLATYFLNEGEYGRAVELLEGVIARGLDTYVSRRYQAFAHALLKLGRTDEALRAAEKGIESCAISNSDEDCAAALQMRAYVHAAREEIPAAIADITAALAKIEEARTRLVPSDFFKRDFLRQRDAFYGLAVALQVRQGRPADALETAELARSRAFIDLLASRDIVPKGLAAPAAPAANADGAPASATTDPLSALALTMRGAGSSDRSSVSILPSSSQHLSSIAIAAPARARDLVAVAKRLRSTLLAYWVATDEIYIWVVAPTGVIRATRVEVLATRLARLVRETAPFAGQTTPPVAGTITTRGGGQFRPSDRSNAWRELHDLLIRPVLADLPSASGSLLTIVPHGPLAGLSFAALQNERGRYLLEDYALHYTSAGAVLQYTGASRRANARSGARPGGRRSALAARAAAGAVAAGTAGRPDRSTRRSRNSFRASARPCSSDRTPPRSRVTGAHRAEDQRCTLRRTRSFATTRRSTRTWRWPPTERRQMDG